MRSFIEDLRTLIMGRVTGYLQHGKWYIHVTQSRVITDDPIWITNMTAVPPISSRPLRIIQLDIDIEVYGYWAATDPTVRLINWKLDKQYKQKLKDLWKNR